MPTSFRLAKTEKCCEATQDAQSPHSREVEKLLVPAQLNCTPPHKRGLLVRAQHSFPVT